MVDAGRLPGPLSSSATRGRCYALQVPHCELRAQAHDAVPSAGGELAADVRLAAGARIVVGAELVVDAWLAAVEQWSASAALTVAGMAVPRRNAACFRRACFRRAHFRCARADAALPRRARPA